MIPQHYLPPGRLAPAMLGYYMSDNVPGAVVVAYPHAVLAAYVESPPPGTTMDMLVAIYASKKAIEEVDDVLKRLFNVK